MLCWCSLLGGGLEVRGALFESGCLSFFIFFFDFSSNSDAFLFILSLVLVIIVVCISFSAGDILSMRGCIVVLSISSSCSRILMAFS